LNTKKIIEISVPYTESQLTADATEEKLNFYSEGFTKHLTLEMMIEELYEEGYNMEVFE